MNYPSVGQGHSVHPRLCVEKALVLRLHVLRDRVPAARVVDGVAEAGSVDDGEGEVDAALFH